CVHLCTGLLRRNDSILLVASVYANHAQPLWNLPGGRQQRHELLRDTLAREAFEETGLHARVRELLYVSESYDGDRRFTNFTFRIEADGEPRRPDGGTDHVVGVAWVPIDELEVRIAVRVVRDPLLAYLRGANRDRYTGYADAGITIQWPECTK
ncbi:MAG: NUDIX domain-containing protein, partial [Vulcanimicrobiaceae bacterium]